jgi:hypothetical protein
METWDTQLRITVATTPARCWPPCRTSISATRSPPCLWRPVRSIRAPSLPMAVPPAGVTTTTAKTARIRISARAKTWQTQCPISGSSSSRCELATIRAPRRPTRASARSPWAATMPVRCWGDNAGEIGAGLVTMQFADTVPAVQIDAGNHHTCAVFANGGARCWGLNSNGQLGLVATSTFC